MSFASIVGQSQAVRTLVSALESSRVPHAYLFAGPPGSGKRATALAWAKVLQCLQPFSSSEACGVCQACRKIDALSHPDVLLVDGAYQAALLDEPVEKQQSLKINTVREVERALRLKPMEGRVKVAILDAADTLVEAAAHALLKLLEEPPPNTHLVLLVEHSSQVLGTLRSRCQWIRFRPLPEAAIRDHLASARPDLSEEEVRRAVRASEGSLTQALSFVDQTQEEPFDWARVSLSELFQWCDRLGNPKSGRDTAYRFVTRLHQDLALEVRETGGSPRGLEQTLQTLQQLRDHVSPGLAVATLLLTLRRERKRRAA